MRHTISTTAAVATAVLLSVGIGCVIAWSVFATRMPARFHYAGLLPAVGVLVVYLTVAVAMLGRKEEPITTLIVAMVRGMILALIFGAALILTIGCRYDACINL